jgi:hypothetical protein
MCAVGGTHFASGLFWVGLGVGGIVQMYLQMTENSGSVVATPALLRLLLLLLC